MQLGWARYISARCNPLHSSNIDGVDVRFALTAGGCAWLVQSSQTVEFLQVRKLRVSMSTTDTLPLRRSEMELQVS